MAGKEPERYHTGCVQQWLRGNTRGGYGAAQVGMPDITMLVMSPVAARQQRCARKVLWVLSAHTDTTLFIFLPRPPVDSYREEVGRQVQHLQGRECHDVGRDRALQLVEADVDMCHVD